MASKLVRIKQEDLDFIKRFEGKDIENLSNIINFYKTFTETQNSGFKNARPITKPSGESGELVKIIPDINSEEGKDWYHFENRLRPQAKDLDKPQSDIFFASILRTLYTSETKEDVIYKERQFEAIPVATRQTIIENCITDLEKWKIVFPDFFHNYLDWTSDFQQTIDARIRTLSRRTQIAKHVSREDHRISFYFWKGFVHAERIQLDVLNSYINAPASKELKLPKLTEQGYEIEPDKVGEVTPYKLWFGKDEN